MALWNLLQQCLRSFSAFFCVCICQRCCTANDSNGERLAVKFCSPYLKLSFCCCESHRLVVKHELSGTKTLDISCMWGYELNFRMVFYNSYLVLKTNWAVTLYEKLLWVRIPKSLVSTQVDYLGELVAKLTIDYRKRVDGDEYLVAFTVNSDGVVVVLVGLVTSGGELNVNVLRHTCGQHSFFVVLDFEEWRLGRQDVQPLGCWRVVYEFDFQRVGLVGFKPCKF